MSTMRWTLTANYNYMDWSRNTSDKTSADYENQHKLNVGVGYALMQESHWSLNLNLTFGERISRSRIK